MFNTRRIQLREAEQAFRQGQWEEASQLLQQADLLGTARGRNLNRQIVLALLDRANLRIASCDIFGGLRDLQQVKALTGETSDYAVVHSNLVRQCVREATRHLQAGDASGAIAQVNQYDKIGVSAPPLRALKLAARHIDSARTLAWRGDYADALQQLTQAAAVKQGLDFLDAVKQQYQHQQLRDRQLRKQLHAALETGDYNAALAAADEILEFAPDHPLAKETRRQAWTKVKARLDAAGSTGASHADTAQHSEATVFEPQKNAMTAASADNSSHAGSADTPQDDPQASQPATIGNQFLLWVDAVGGFMVCRGTEVTIGQATPRNKVDIPILADLTKRHATIIRQEEDYIIEPGGKVLLDGREITKREILTSGVEIALGSAVTLRFTKPHALSATARLDVVSRHRTQPNVDGILLMAESLVLGPNWHNHVVCRDWPDDVVLFQQREKVYCRSMEPLEVDGKLCEGPAALAPHSHIAGETFSMSLEAFSS